MVFHPEYPHFPRHPHAPQPPLVHLDRRKQSYYYSPTVGAYDVAAIKFGYSVGGADVPVADDGTLLGSPFSPEATLPPRALAALQEGHPFCTDDDDSRPTGRDPTCSTYDLTSDVRASADLSGMRCVCR